MKIKSGNLYEPLPQHAYQIDFHSASPSPEGEGARRADEDGKVQGRRGFWKIKSHIPVVLFAIVFASAISSCRKDYFVPPPVDLSAPVSFSEMIQPILTEDCAISGCHVEGGQVPDLDEEDAYDQLLLLGYVDTTIYAPDTFINPEHSILYKRITSASDPMPPDEPLSPSEINTIYAWIAQGAKNN